MQHTDKYLQHGDKLYGPLYAHIVDMLLIEN